LRNCGGQRSDARISFGLPPEYQPIRMLNIIDQFTRECLTIRIGRKLKALDVIDTLSDLFILRGVPGHIRSDNGPEFVPRAVRQWIAAVGAETAYIMPGSPWENGYCESFDSKLRERVAQWRDILYAGGGQGRHRRMAPALQNGPAALLLGLRPPDPEAMQWPASHPGPASPATPTVAPARGIH
jgi:putative transposase